MKQIFRSLAVIALCALAASCAKEQTAAPLGEETTVSFTVAAPVIQTKAISDGTTVNKVDCCVYDSDGKLITNDAITKTIEMENGKATFSVRLVTGQKYSFIFWAYKASVEEGWTSPYTLDKANKKVTVSYTGAACNDERRDAFYAYEADVDVTGALSRNVTLKRPFAQLNFGVEKDDITAAAAAGITVSKSKVTLTNLGNELNLVSGEVTGDATAVFALATCPMSEDTPETLKVGGTEYGYVAMNYILANGNTTATLFVADADGNLIKADGLEVSNVPLKANYRTNILGNLFTSQVITSIEVAPAFEEPDIEKEVWSGQINEPSTNTEGKYLITKASELAWVAKQNNDGTKDFNNTTILLENDIDLCNGFWTPIGTGSKPFKGTFDGQSHTISNLNVYSTVASDNLGLFGYITTPAKIENFTIDGAKVISEVVQADGAASAAAIGKAQDGSITIQNINVKNAVVTSNHYAGGICGYCYAGIKNCTVDTITVTCNPVYWLGKDKNHENGDKAGGIVGYLADGYFTLSGCSVKIATIYGYRDLGGICGYANSNTTISNSSIENVTISVTATEAQNYKEYYKKSEFDANPYIGENNGSISTCTGTASITYPTYITQD